MPRIRGNSVSIATNKILKKIQNYELLTGDIVSDLELSKEFNMSRTPIREAIMSLLDHNILERTTTKVVVKAITLSDIIEILQVREAIEQKCAQILIENGGLNDDQKNHLLSIHEKLIENIVNGNIDSNFDADDLFHKEIIKYSGNSRFLDIYKRLTLQSQRLRWITMLTPSRYSETREEHTEILTALFDMDIDKTKQAIHNHIYATQKNYENILNNPHWSKIAQEIKHMNG